MTSTPPFTYDDLVRMYQQMMNEPYRPYVDVDQMPTPPPVPSASDRSGYAEYLLTGRCPLRPGIADRCAP